MAQAPVNSIDDPSNVLMLSIGRLELKPGDMLAVISRLRLSQAEIARLEAYLHERLPDTRIVILDGDFDLTVMGPSSLEAALPYIRGDIAMEDYGAAWKKATADG